MSFTSGDRLKMQADLGAVALYLDANSREYRNSIAGWRKRRNRDQLKKGISKAEGLLKKLVRAQGVPVMLASRPAKKTLEKACEKVVSARKLIDMPASAIVAEVRGAGRSGVQSIEKSTDPLRQVNVFGVMTWVGGTAAQRAARNRKEHAHARMLASRRQPTGYSAAAGRRARAFAERARQQALARARQQHVPYDRAMTAAPYAQSDVGKAMVATVLRTRDQLQQQVAQGQMTADEAKGELDAMFTSGDGAAIAAQDQQATSEWQQASAESMDAAEGAKATAEAVEEQVVASADAAAASGGRRAMLVPTLIGSVVGAGSGYAAAEKPSERATYAAAGGFAGAAVGLVIGVVLKRRAERRAAAVTAPAASASQTAAIVPSESEPVEGWY
jgi:hypothetical protein